MGRRPVPISCDAISRNERAWLIAFSWSGPFRCLVSQAEEFGPTPARAGDREGNLRQAWIGLAVPGKAVGEHRNPLHLPVPFPGQHGAWVEFCGAPAEGHGPARPRRARLVSWVNPCYGAA
jgi:hypothetical protein